MATEAELQRVRDLIVGLEEQLQIDKQRGDSTRSTEEELRRQYQILENLQR